MPDRTAFEEAHLAFSIEGPQMRVREVALLGHAPQADFLESGVPRAAARRASGAA